MTAATILADLRGRGVHLAPGPWRTELAGYDP